MQKGQKDIDFDTWYAEECHDVPEQWWDRQDSSHDGIPLGNIPVPGDKFGRWGDVEIRGGEMKQVGEYKKGNRGEDGFTQWNKDGSIHSLKRGRFYAEYGLSADDGAMPNYVEIDDSAEDSYDGKSYSWGQLRDAENADIVAEAERIYRENSRRLMAPHDKANLKEFLKSS